MRNLSQQKRAEMLAYLNHLKEIHTDDESRIALEKIETALTEKKYGLVWEKHEEEVDKKLVHHIPVFREMKEKKIVGDNTGDFNFLLEGDNLHSLKLLEKTHKGKIDVIYIDPPYNRGKNDFTYDDNYIVKEDGYRHSKWLSFMNERLVIAQKLLSDKGVIFISIDDNEQAQLKLLCDEIFDEENFVATYKWERTSTPPSLSNKVRGKYEYIHCYENKKNPLKYNGGLVDGGDVPLLNKGNGYKTILFNKDTVKFYIDGIYPKGNYHEVELLDDINVINGKANKNFSIKGEFKWVQETVNEEVNMGTYFLIKSRKLSIRFQRADKKIKSPTDIISKRECNIGTNETAKKELQEIVPDNYMDYPKPTSLIKYLIKFTENNRQNNIILDFFAGSGTTGQAVMELNKEDGGSRKFILCTNNENNICENITYKRLSRVIKGYEFSGKIKNELRSYTLNKPNLERIDAIFQEFEDIKSEKKEDYDKFSMQSKDGILKLIGEKEILDRKTGIPHNIKYYKTEFIPKFSEDEDILSSKLLDYIKEMVELEHMCEIDSVTRRIILSDEDLKVALSEMKESGSLYIPSFILLDNETKEKIEERKLEVVTIPDYYFTEELREVNEL